MEVEDVLTNNRQTLPLTCGISVAIEQYAAGRSTQPGDEQQNHPSTPPEISRGVAGATAATMLLAMLLMMAMMVIAAMAVAPPWCSR